MYLIPLITGSLERDWFDDFYPLKKYFFSYIYITWIKPAVGWATCNSIFSDNKDLGAKAVQK